MSKFPLVEDRLEAWFDGSAVCIIGVGTHGDPLDLSDEEVERYIEVLQSCLRESRGNPRGL